MDSLGSSSRGIAADGECLLELGSRSPKTRSQFFDELSLDLWVLPESK